MYGFPLDFDCKTFIGKCLEMVCYNSTQIYLHFSGKVFITINGTFSHHIYEDKTVHKHTMPVFYPDFINLCEKEVSDAFVENNGDLCLVFEGNEKVCLHENLHYESYEINEAGKRMII